MVMRDACALLVIAAIAACGAPRLELDAANDSYRPPASIDAAPIGDAPIPHVVCAVGDSITGGYGPIPQAGGYRVPLAAARPELAWVGTLSNFGPNEGHSGWRTWQIRHFVLPLVDELAPDTILLLIGTNDLTDDGLSPDDQAEDYALLASEFLRHPSVTHVYASTLPPRRDTTERNDRTARVNALLPAAFAHVAGASIVDVAGVLTTSELSDSLHPNTTGYATMAARWDASLP